MSEDQRRKRPWPGPPRTDPYGREGDFPGSFRGRGRGPPWQNRRGRVDGRGPWGGGGRQPAFDSRQQPPGASFQRNIGPRRNSPGYDELPRAPPRDGPPKPHRDPWSGPSGGGYPGPPGSEAEGVPGFTDMSMDRASGSFDRRPSGGYPSGRPQFWRNDEPASSHDRMTHPRDFNSRDLDLSGRASRDDTSGEFRRDSWPRASTQPVSRPTEGSYLNDSTDPYSNLPSSLPGSFGHVPGRFGGPGYQGEFQRPRSNVRPSSGRFSPFRGSRRPDRSPRGSRSRSPRGQKGSRRSRSSRPSRSPPRRSRSPRRRPRSPKRRSRSLRRRSKSPARQRAAQGGSKSHTGDKSPQRLSSKPGQSKLQNDAQSQAEGHSHKQPSKAALEKSTVSSQHTADAAAGSRSESRKAHRGLAEQSPLAVEGPSGDAKDFPGPPSLTSSHEVPHSISSQGIAAASGQITEEADRHPLETELPPPPAKLPVKREDSPPPQDPPGSPQDKALEAAADPVAPGATPGVAPTASPSPVPALVETLQRAEHISSPVLLPEAKDNAPDAHKPGPTLPAEPTQKISTPKPVQPVKPPEKKAPGASTLDHLAAEYLRIAKELGEPVGILAGKEEAVKDTEAAGLVESVRKQAPLAQEASDLLETPSEEKPKRKRLGWGQGLARLSKDYRLSGESEELRAVPSSLVEQLSSPQVPPLDSFTSRPALRESHGEGFTYTPTPGDELTTPGGTNPSDLVLTQQTTHQAMSPANAETEGANSEQEKGTKKLSGLPNPSSGGADLSLAPSRRLSKCAEELNSPVRQLRLATDVPPAPVSPFASPISQRTQREGYGNEASDALREFGSEDPDKGDSLNAEVLQTPKETDAGEEHDGPKDQPQGQNPPAVPQNPIEGSKVPTGHKSGFDESFEAISHEIAAKNEALQNAKAALENAQLRLANLERRGPLVDDETDDEGASLSGASSHGMTDPDQGRDLSPHPTRAGPSGATMLTHQDNALSAIVNGNRAVAASAAADDEDDVSCSSSDTEIRPEMYPDHREQDDHGKRILLENRMMVAQTKQELYGLGPIPKARFQRIEAAPQYGRNILKFQKDYDAMREGLKFRKQDLWDTDVQIYCEYKDLFEAWKEYHRNHVLGKQTILDEHVREKLYDLRVFPAIGEDREYWERPQIAEFWSHVRDAAKRALNHTALCLHVPDQIVDVEERRAATFVSDNARIEDPVEELRSRKDIRPWSEEEKRIFNDKCLAHYKDFAKIASYLEYRSTTDCVTHFFAVQKSEEFAPVARKLALKKRKQRSDANTSKQKSFMGMPVVLTEGRRARASIMGAGARSSQEPDLENQPGRGRLGRPPSRVPSRIRPFPSIPSSSAVSNPNDYPAEDTNIAPLHEGPIPWSFDDEHQFLQGLRIHGKNFKEISRFMNEVRTVGACKAFYAKHNVRLNLDMIVADVQRRQDLQANPNPFQDNHQPFQMEGPEQNQEQEAQHPSEFQIRQSVSSQAFDSGTVGQADAQDVALPAPLEDAHVPAGLTAEDRSNSAPQMPMNMPPSQDMGLMFPQYIFPGVGGMPYQEGMYGGMQAGSGYLPQVPLEAQAGAMGGPTPAQLQFFLQLSLLQQNPGVLQNPNFMQQQAMNLLQQPHLQQMLQNAQMAHMGFGNMMAMPQVYQMLAQGGANPAALQFAAALGGMQPMMPPEYAPAGILPGSFPASTTGVPLGSGQGAFLRVPGQFPLMGVQGAETGFGQAPSSEVAAPAQEPQETVSSRGEPKAAASARQETETAALEKSDAVAQKEDKEGRTSKEPLPEESGPTETSSRRSASLWTAEEKEAFISCYKVHGRDWKRLTQAVPNKTETQIKNYFQNYKSKLGLDKIELPPSAIQPGQRRRREKPDPKTDSKADLKDQKAGEKQSAVSQLSSLHKASASSNTDQLPAGSTPPVLQQGTEHETDLTETAPSNPTPTTQADSQGDGGASGSRQVAGQSYTIPAAQWLCQPQKEKEKSGVLEAALQDVLSHTSGKPDTVKNILQLIQSNKGVLDTSQARLTNSGAVGTVTSQQDADKHSEVSAREKGPETQPHDHFLAQFTKSLAKEGPQVPRSIDVARLGMGGVANRGSTDLSQTGALPVPVFRPQACVPSARTSKEGKPQAGGVQSFETLLRELTQATALANTSRGDESQPGTGEDPTSFAPPLPETQQGHKQTDSQSGPLAALSRGAPEQTSRALSTADAFSVLAPTSHIPPPHSSLTAGLLAQLRSRSPGVGVSSMGSATPLSATTNPLQESQTSSPGRSNRPQSWLQYPSAETAHDAVEGSMGTERASLARLIELSKASRPDQSLGEETDRQEAEEAPTGGRVPVVSHPPAASPPSLESEQLPVSGVSNAREELSDVPASQDQSNPEHIQGRSDQDTQAGGRLEVNPQAGRSSPTPEPIPEPFSKRTAQEARDLATQDVSIHSKQGPRPGEVTLGADSSEAQASALGRVVAPSSLPAVPNQGTDVSEKLPEPQTEQTEALADAGLFLTSEERGRNEQEAPVQESSTEPPQASEILKDPPASIAIDVGKLINPDS